MPELERRYRRLLRAYPRAYRDRRGTEMVTTLLEMAEAGEGRPGPRESAHLVLAGVRQRFRPPALAGWMVAAAFACRLRGRGRLQRRAATALTVAGFAALTVPAYQHYRDAYQVLTYAHGSPYPYIVDGPSEIAPTLAGTAIGLLAVVAALVAIELRRVRSAAEA
jgi:hypothetical protein